MRLGLKIILWVLAVCVNEHNTLNEQNPVCILYYKRQAQTTFYVPEIPVLFESVLEAARTFVHEVWESLTTTMQY